MLVSKQNTMAMKSYQNHAEVFVRDYLLDDSFVPYTSIIGGIFACKLVYDLTQLMSTIYFKSYCNLTKMQRIEWNNRAISTIHALFITTLSLYFVFMSDLFSDERLAGLITHRSSALSTFALGISVGYFIADIGMIIWFYPSLGGMEYHCPFGVLLAICLHHYFFDNWVIHHLLSMAAVAYAMLTGEGQLYTYMVLISETTTPGVNLRWYLDAAGMKKSRTYLINGVVMFVAWLVARILLFMYLFYHVFLHYDQVKELHGFGRLLIFVVPVVLSAMNSMWFWKIIRGLKKTLAKRQ